MRTFLFLLVACSWLKESYVLRSADRLASSSEHSGIDLLYHSGWTRFVDNSVELLACSGIGVDGHHLINFGRCSWALGLDKVKDTVGGR